MSKRIQDILIIATFSLALILRISLAWVNQDANDNHHQAVQKMIETNSLTSYIDCAQCYHPKLFHITVAIFQETFNINEFKSQMRIGQFINVFMGFFFLMILWQFIKYQKWRPIIQILVFAIIAFNPKLVAINAQYTNDTFVFTFSALAILGAYRLLHKFSKGTIGFIVLGCIGASLSKGSGIPITLSLLVFLTILYFIRQEKLVLKTVVLTLISFLLIVPYFGNYISNFNDSEQVLGLNGEKSPAPHFSKKTYVDRPGVISIIHSYGTFPIIDLIKHPYINNDPPYAKNRTSVWAQVYGRSFSVRFDQWPLSWMDTSKKTIITTRILLLLGIIPTILFLLGAVESIYHLCSGFVKRKMSSKWLDDLLMLLILASMITMLLKLTFEHRDFCTMKAIYIWPGLISIAYFMGVAFNRYLTKSISAFLIFPFLAFILFSIYEIVSLIIFL